MDYLVFLFSIYVLPAIILGILLGSPVWLYWIIQKVLRFHPSRINSTFIVLVSLLSFVTAFCIYTYEIIKTVYVFTIPSSPIAEEKMKYQDEAINEAFQQSIIPPLFQKICADKPDSVCKLGKDYSLKLWDTNLTDDDVPFLSGLASSFASVLFIMLGNKVFQEW